MSSIAPSTISKLTRRMRGALLNAGPLALLVPYTKPPIYDVPDSEGLQSKNAVQSFFESVPSVMSDNLPKKGEQSLATEDTRFSVRWECDPTSATETPKTVDSAVFGACALSRKGELQIFYGYNDKAWDLVDTIKDKKAESCTEIYKSRGPCPMTIYATRTGRRQTPESEISASGSGFRIGTQQSNTNTAVRDPSDRSQNTVKTFWEVCPKEAESESRGRTTFRDA